MEDNVEMSCLGPMGLNKGVAELCLFEKLLKEWRSSNLSIVFYCLL